MNKLDHVLPDEMPKQVRPKYMMYPSHGIDGKYDTIKADETNGQIKCGSCSRVGEFLNTPIRSNRKLCFASIFLLEPERLAGGPSAAWVEITQKMGTP